VPTIDDYYVLLGIEESASLDEVRTAWRHRALEYHPDRAGTDATLAFQKLSVAYAVLSDPEARAAYDARRGKGRARPAPSTSQPASEPPLRRAPGTLVHRLCSPLNILIARGSARHVEPGLIELFATADEVAEGGMISIAMSVDVHGRDELFTAWLALRPGSVDGTLLRPSVLLPGMQPLAFRLRVLAAAPP
jgi:curved DNA-binding protein CbpA